MAIGLGTPERGILRCGIKKWKVTSSLVTYRFSMFPMAPSDQDHLIISGPTHPRFAFMSLWPESVYIHRGNHEENCHSIPEDSMILPDFFQLRGLAPTMKWME